MSAPGFHVVFFGPVGVGKSTLTRALSATWNGPVYTLAEPSDALERSGALRALYENRPGSGVIVQSIVAAERMRAMRAMRDTLASRPANCKPALLVSDGSVYLDPHIFIEEHLRAGRMDMGDAVSLLTRLQKCFEKPEKCPTLPADLFVFLDSPGRVCLGRAKLRDRSAENALDVAFFDRMRAACQRASCLVPEQLLRVVDVSGPLHEALRAVSEQVQKEYKKAFFVAH